MQDIYIVMLVVILAIALFCLFSAWIIIAVMKKEMDERDKIMTANFVKALERLEWGNEKNE